MQFILISVKNIYNQLGGQKLFQIINRFYDRVFESPVIAHLFVNDPEEIRNKQFLFLTQFLGGPQRYTEIYGHPRMRMRHLPHKITVEARDEWLRCMKASINEVLADDPELAETLYNCFPPVANHMVNS